MSVEIKVGDRPILEEFQKLMSVSSAIRERVRDTNFKKGYRSVIWTVCDLGFRKELKKLGVPTGKKKGKVTVPKGVSLIDYFRGIIDGDGSVCVSSEGLPTVGLSTTSKGLAEGFITFLEPILGYRKRTTPNKRDGSYNVIVQREWAVALCEKLYYEECLALPRKRVAAFRMMSWKRSEGIMRIYHRRWSDEEDELVRSKGVEEAARLLQRSNSSIKTRRWRLGIRTLQTSRVGMKHWSKEELKLLESWDITEIAKKTGRTEGAVLAQRHRQRKKSS